MVFEDLCLKVNTNFVYSKGMSIFFINTCVKKLKLHFIYEKNMLKCINNNFSLNFFFRFVFESFSKILDIFFLLLKVNAKFLYTKLQC